MHKETQVITTKGQLGINIENPWFYLFDNSNPKLLVCLKVQKSSCVSVCLCLLMKIWIIIETSIKDPNKVLWKIVKLFVDIHLVFVQHFIQSYFASYAMIYIIKVTKPALLTFSDKLIDKQLHKGEIISHWSYVNMKEGGLLGYNNLSG